MPVDPDAELIEDRYEVGPMIGRGAMGEVHRGRDRRLHREVAIKRLRPDLAADDGVRARFEDEARAAARLNHPSIVAVYDSGEWKGAPYLVMECLPGKTLADELGGGRMPAERVREIAVDIGSALDAAHRLGVIHRDVKPGNILLTADGRAKLADFGIAKSTEAMGSHTQTGLIVGTPAYLAPERLEGTPATAQSDVYSLGVVLYEALTGERPFRGDTPVAVAHAIHATTPARLRDRVPPVEPRLAAAVDAAMAKEPADRLRSAAAMLAMLGNDAPTAAVTGVSTSDTRPMSTSHANVATTRRPMAMPNRWTSSTSSERRTVAVAAAVLFVMMLLVILWRGAPDGTEGPTTTVAPSPATTAPLPPPLDDAITDLEESVRP